MPALGLAQPPRLRVDDLGLAVHDHEPVAAVPRDQPPDDAIGQGGALAVAVAGDDDPYVGAAQGGRPGRLSLLGWPAR
jgi:hypothetical protein